SDGRWREYVGGYSDWVAQRPAAVPIAAPGTGAAAPRARSAPASRTRLSFKEQRELEALPAELEALEQEQLALTARMSAADYHRQAPDAIRADRLRATAIEHALAQKFERWGELDA